MRYALRFSVLSLALVASSFAASTGARAGAPVEFTAELKALASVAACNGEAFDEQAFDGKVVAAHCADLKKIFDGYRKDWLTPARPFFDQLVPKDVPKTVIYPFSGADLLTALAVYPNFTELTSASLEAGGDPRTILRISSKELAEHLAKHRKFMGKLVYWNHSRTLDLEMLKGTPLPSQLIFALVGLDVHGYEPVSLQAIRLNDDGTIHVFDADDVAAIDAKAKGLKGASLNRKLNDLFGSYALTFRKKGNPQAPLQTYRHFQANLDNEHLAADARILKHLGAKGPVAAMTKGASYLLWWGNFKTIREFLKAHVTWMVSDSTGIRPVHLESGTWEQTTYGIFDGAPLKEADGQGVKEMLALWKAQPTRVVPFRFFGYPSRHLHGHLVVTRKR